VEKRDRERTGDFRWHKVRCRQAIYLVKCNHRQLLWRTLVSMCEYKTHTQRSFRMTQRKLYYKLSEVVLSWLVYMFLAQCLQSDHLRLDTCHLYYWLVYVVETSATVAWLRPPTHFCSISLYKWSVLESGWTRLVLQ